MNRRTMTRNDRLAARPGRGARRARASLVTLVAGTLVWASLAFLQSAGTTASTVQVVPGTDDGGIAEVVALAGEVTTARGKAQLQEGVKVARIDVASAYQQNFRVTVAWQNATEFSQATLSNGWQIRYGLYYPVRTGLCSAASHASDDANGAISITLDGAETFTGSGSQTFCAYRDTTANGSGVVTSGDHAGTQMLARERLLGMLAPKLQLTSGGACGALSNATYCTPAGLDSAKHAYFVIASMVNPGSKIPAGQQGGLDPLETFVRVRPGTA